MSERHDEHLGIEDEVKVTQIALVISHLVRIQWLALSDKKMVTDNPVFRFAVKCISNPRERGSNVMCSIEHSFIEAYFTDNDLSNDLAFIRDKEVFTLDGCAGISGLFP